MAGIEGWTERISVAEVEVEVVKEDQYLDMDVVDREQIVDPAAQSDIVD